LSINPILETDEDLQLVKEYVLLPILIDMLNRDVVELKAYSDRIIFSHLVYYLNEVEHLIYLELQRNKIEMRKRNIKILGQEKGNLGVEVDYKIRGYTHKFTNAQKPS
jgi:hypothetical protein